jgi:flagellar protein FlgJ
MPKSIQSGISPPIPTSNASTYTDPNGLAALKKDPNSPQAIRAVAQQVDALFLQMMLKSMRDANAAVGEADSNEMGMYQDMFDKQIALTMSQHQDLGLGALVTRQMSATAAAARAAGAAAAGGSAAGSAPAAAGSNGLPAARVAGAAVPGAPAAPPTPVPATSAAPTTAVPATSATPSTPAAPPTSMTQAAAQFVAQVLPSIQVAAQSLGISPLAMLAQAALETGWGKRMARTATGAPSLNLFGVKADGNWSGARATANTVEYSGGVATQRQTAFRAYGSVQESISDFANLLKSSPRYARALAAGGNAQAYIAHIGQSGYATDPEYANKLNEILNGGALHGALTAKITKL